MLSPDGNYGAFLAAVAVAWTVVAASVLLLFVKALSVFTVGMFFDNETIAQQRDVARGTVGSGLDLLGEWVSTLSAVFTQGLLYLVTVLLYFGIVIVFAVLLHVGYLHFPIMLGSTTAGWNNTVGRYWEEYGLASMQYAEYAFEEVVGAYNFLVFLLVKMPISVFFRMASAGMGDIGGFGREMGRAGAAFVQAVNAWAQATTRECEDTRFGVRDITCYDPSLRTLDLYTPLLHVNKAVVHVMDFVPRTCQSIGAPVALLLYPLTDSELSKGVHFLVDSLQQIAQAFFIAELRWRETRRVAMSVPDFAPSFDSLSYALLHFGRCVDNWVDVAFYAMSTLADPELAQACDSVGGSWDFDLQRRLMGSFGGNRTVLTALTPTLFAVSDGHSVEYHHHGRRGGVRMSLAAWPIHVNITYGLAAVAYARDMSRDDTATGHTTALLGCSCVDDVEEGIQVLCAIVPYESVEGVSPSAFLVDVGWEVANTPKRMLCRDTKIAVESVRFQAQRVSSPADFDGMPTLDRPVSCMTAGTCTKIDAAVWIMPVCPITRPGAFTGVAQPPGGETACLRALRDFSCFPFCLGVHRTFAANERMIIRSSGAWEDNVLLAGRDCVFERIDEVAGLTSQQLMTEAEDAAATWAPHSPAGAQVPHVKMSRGAQDDARCVVNENMFSSVPSLEAERHNSTRMFRDLYSFGEGKAHADEYAEALYRFAPTDAMLVEQQPLVFAGDYALRTMTYCTPARGGAAVAWDGSQERNDGCYTVLDVMRITSNEHNAFQLRHVLPYGIPVTRRPTTAAQTTAALRPGMATLPPVLVRSVYLHNPAASTRGAVWYAVNHDFEMLHCVARYCREFTTLPNCLSFSVLSNYEKMRIWKITPGGGCTRHPVTGQPVCPDHAVRSTAFNGSHDLPLQPSADFDFGGFCREDNDMNLYIEDMEAFDAFNVAVAMRRGNVQALYDELWGRGGGSARTTPRARTVYYFINVQTLEIRENEPWVDAPVLLDGAGFLCPQLRVMPPLGSAVAEAFSAGVFLARMLAGMLLGIPGLVELYSDPSARCELAKRSWYHSLYRECGTAYMDLSDMFDAVNRANVHLWSSLDTVGRVVGMASDDESVQVLQTFLAGSQLMQENRVILSKSSVVSGVISLGETNSPGLAVGGGGMRGGGYLQLVTGVSTPQFMAGMNAGVAPIAMAEYSYRLAARVIDRVVVISRQAKLDGSSGMLTLRFVAGNMTVVWYDSLRTDFNDLVLNRMRRVCSGLSLVMGYTNTYARFLRHWCLAGVEFTGGSMGALGGFLVELPLTVCVCVSASSRAFGPYLRDVCAPQTSPSLRNFIAAMLTWENDIFAHSQLDRQGKMQDVCTTTMAAFEDSLFNAFSPWVLQHTEAAHHTVSLLDYIGVLMGQQSAECAAASTNPFVSVMVPAPIDYFRVCGTTSVCKIKCAAYRDALDREIAARSGAHRLSALPFRTTLESPMFARLAWGDPQGEDMRLAAITELHIEHDDCRFCGDGDSDCVAAVGSRIEQGLGHATQLDVRTYCVPFSMDRRVFMGTQWAIDDTHAFPVSQLLDPGTDDRIMRVAFSVPFGDHVIVLSQTHDFTADGEQFTHFFQHLHVWRSNTRLRMHVAATAATVAEECMSELAGLVEPVVSALREDAGDKSVFFNSLVDRVSIVDFVTIVSQEYTIDLVLSLDVVVLLFYDAAFAPPVRRVFPMYVRLGWCEYLPTDFQGHARAVPTECEGVWASRVSCLGIDQNMAGALFRQWLSDGNLLYLPVEARYAWLPSSSVSFSVLPHILPVNISLKDNYLHVGLHEPLMVLSGGSVTGRVLGQPYWADAGGRSGTSHYTGLLNSAVGHWRAAESGAYERSLTGRSLWYAAASELLSGSWLHDVRYDDDFLTLRTYSSTKHVVDVEVQRYCDGYTCSGCSTLRLRQLCSALQSCMLTGCVGSVVNEDNLLCNAGMLLESIYSQTLGMYVAVWHALVSVVITGLESRGHSTVAFTVRAEWASDVVYTLVCEIKDVHATATAFLATIMHRGGSSSAIVTAGFDNRGTRVVNKEAYSSDAMLVSAWHQLMFQTTLLPLYMVFGLHRWGVCSLTDVVHMASDGKIQLALGGGTENEGKGRDDTQPWAACSTAAAVEEIMGASRNAFSADGITTILNDVMGSEMSVESMQNGDVPFSPLDLFVHMFDAAIAWAVGVVTGVQDVLYNTDSLDCQATNVEAADAVQCACGDEPASVVPERRSETFASGALWCSGVLYVALDDGSFGHIYNPYSLEELGRRVQPRMHAYLQCISSSDEGPCVAPSIAVFAEAGVSALTVLTRCRANYMQRQWDVGATMLFDPEFKPLVSRHKSMVDGARKVALKWAADTSPELLACVKRTAGSSDFASCMDVFLAASTQTFANGREEQGARRETYFAYSAARVDASMPALLPPPKDNPDACVVFSGPAAHARSAADRARFDACMHDSPTSSASDCTLDPLAWAGRLHSRTPVVAVHRDVVTDPVRRERVRDALYAEAHAEIQRAFDTYDAGALDNIDVLFFSAEGDVLHQMMDCMFLGPYTKAEYIVGDSEGNLPPLDWFRDNASGTTRDFDLPCAGEKLHGDREGTPFTCGSPARRAVIKMYVREYMFRNTTTGARKSATDVTRDEISKKVQALRQPYLDTRNYACPGGECGDPLHGGSGFAPALPPFGQVNVSQVSAAVFSALPSFFADALTNATIWTHFYRDSVHTDVWGNWRGNAMAADYHLFAPNTPVVSYNASEARDMVAGDSFLNSVWGTCASLLAQPMLTVPLTQYAEDGSAHADKAERPAWMPKALRDGSLGRFDPFAATDDNPSAVHDWVQQLLQEAWVHSPMFMHYVARHVPSQSLVCEHTPVRAGPDVAQSRVRMQDGVLLTQPEDGGPPQQHTVFGMRGSEFVLRGFLKDTLGAAERTCPCGFVVRGQDGRQQCEFNAGVCTAVLANARAQNASHSLVGLCATGMFPLRHIPLVLEGLHLLGNGLPGSACPDFLLSEQMGLFPFRNEDRAWNEQWLPGDSALDQGFALDFDAMDMLAHLPAGLSPGSLDHVIGAMRNGSGWGHAARTTPLANRRGGSVAQRTCTRGTAQQQQQPAPSAQAPAQTPTDTTAEEGLGISIQGSGEGDQPPPPPAQAPEQPPEQGAADADTDTDDSYAEFTSDLLDDFFDALFPVAQLSLDEAPGVSTCTRFVLERLKLHFTRHVIKSSNTQKLQSSVARWQKRCSIKARQTALCSELRVLSVVPPRDVWRRALPPSCRGLIDEAAFEREFGSQFYITPGCVLFAGGAFYRTHACRENTQQNVSLAPQHLQPACRLHDTPYEEQTDTRAPHHFNPLQLAATGGQRVLHWGLGTHMRDTTEYARLLDRIDEREQALGASALQTDLSKLFLHAIFENIMLLPQQRTAKTTTPFATGNMDMTQCPDGLLQCEQAQYCDRTFDWWPDDWQQPTGYHPTASCMAKDNAYRTFDSYLAIDRERMRLVYEHTTLRADELLHQFVGAAGLCRLPSVNMPLLQTNTHRVCTQGPKSTPNPSLPTPPVQAGQPAGFGEATCSKAPTEVPWHVDATDDFAQRATRRVVGGVFDLLRVSSEYRPSVGRLLTSPRFPAASALRADSTTLDGGAAAERHAQSPFMAPAGVRPRAGAAEDPWEGCVPQVRVVGCDPQRATSCADGMRCVQGPGPREAICMPVASAVRAGRPCYRSDMCDATEHCLADGVCGKVALHLWNVGVEPLEFTSLVEGGCGDDTEARRVQHFAGASPWETVPDLLQAHGLCAQRHAYSHAFAMAHVAEPDRSEPRRASLRTTSDDGVSPRVDWPWIQQSPTGTMIDEDTRLVDERDRRWMHVHPHVCDRSYMHMPGFAACSGVRGDPDVQMLAYALRLGEGADSGADPLARWTPGAQGTGGALRKATWLRTSSPQDSARLFVSTAFNTSQYRQRGPFAFLGGDKTAAQNTYARKVGDARARFLRCANVAICGPPEYYFAGARVDRVAWDEGAAQWHELRTSDYMACGSLGYLRRDGGASSECIFDLALFPHVRLLATGSSPFCMDLFGAPSGLGLSGAGAGIDVIEQLLSFDAPCTPGRVCCHGDDTSTPLLCKYRALGAPSEGRMLQSNYFEMFSKLNNIHALVTMPADSFAERQSNRMAGVVAECVTDMHLTNVRHQVGLRARYGTAAVSGLYHAFHYHLYETPLLWYYKWVYRTVVWDSALTAAGLLAAAQQWGGSIALGEAWQSRASVQQQFIRRCTTTTCICQRSAGGTRMRDSLLCLNAGARLRVQGGGAGGEQSQWLLESDALGTYMQELRARIRADVFAAVAARYGDIERTVAAGCHTYADWDFEQCMKHRQCVLFLVQNATGIEAQGPYDYDVRKLEFRSFFKLGGWTRSNTVQRLATVVDAIVASYEFVDEEFDPLVDGELRRTPERGWEYPLFRLRREAALTDEFDDVDDDAAHSTYVTVVDHRAEAPERRCIFEGNDVDVMEQGADPDTRQRPLVVLRDAEPGEYAETTVVDVCSNNAAQHYTVRFGPDGPNPGTEQRFRKMACSFRSSEREMGHDFCDTAGAVSGCYAKMRVGDLVMDFKGATVVNDNGGSQGGGRGSPRRSGYMVDEGANTIREPSGRVSKIFRQGLQTTLQCARAGAPYSTSKLQPRVDGSAYEQHGWHEPYDPRPAWAMSRDPPGAAQAPNMQCVQTPYHSECVRAGMATAPYEGHWQSQLAAEWTVVPTARPTPPASPDENKCGWYGSGYICPNDYFWRIFRSFGAAMETLRSMYTAANDSPGFRYSSFQTKAFALPCLVNTGNVRNRPANPLPQRQPFHAMCHRVDSECIPNKDKDVFVTNSGPRGQTECKLRHAQLPPGVAGRFFHLEKPPSQWPPADAETPVWETCPQSDVSRPATLNDVTVPPVPKAAPAEYPQRAAHYGAVTGCTQQVGAEDTPFGQCTTDDGCYIVHERTPSEWFLRKSAQCMQMPGACSFSLTLADGYFCGTGTMVNGRTYPPDQTCPANFRKTLVRGDYIDTRSLWRCAPCLKFNPRQFSGRFACGFAPPGDATAPFASRDVVRFVKEYIRTSVHSLQGLHRLHKQGGQGPLRYKGDTQQPAFDGEGRLVYAQLEELPFAEGFREWAPSPAGPCTDSAHESDTSQKGCAWTGVYDANAVREIDDQYTQRTDSLQCAAEVPRVSDYKTCSAAGSAPRHTLRDFVDEQYRNALGTWMPVLPPKQGVSWQLDRSAVSRPFTIMLASSLRALSQQHARYVLDDSVCTQGAHLESMCADVGDGRVVHVNPWMGGEFNTFLARDGAGAAPGVMGLDQCQRATGDWQTCCSCFPAERCCLPNAACGTAGSTPAPHPLNHFTDTGYRTACFAEEFKNPPGQPMQTDHPTNICMRKPLRQRATVCEHLQGIVGGGDSVPLQSVAELYHESPLTHAYTVEDFLVDANPTLWRGASTTASPLYRPGTSALLRMPSDLLYPAHVVLHAGLRERPTRVRAYQMGWNDGALFADHVLHRADGWVGALEQAFAQDHTRVSPLYPHLTRDAPQQQPWHCPLRMVAFWGADVPGFNPLVPDPTRADFMFRGTHYCAAGRGKGGCVRGVHPFHAPVEAVGIRDFHTTNGLCYFNLARTAAEPADEAQASPVLSQTAPCGLWEHVLAAVDGEWRTSRVLSTAPPCTDTLDWPAYPLDFRSGERAAQQSGYAEPVPQSCGTLGRVAPFRMKFVSDAPLETHPSRTTADEGGDCHMGRATRIPASMREQLVQYEHCVTVARTSTQASVRCTGLRDSAVVRAAAADRLFVLEREVRAHPLRDIVHSGGARQPCGACDAASTPVQGPGHERLLFPETSSGEVRRFSAERALARELGRECDAQSGCAPERALWKRGAFLQNLLLDPHALVVDSSDTGHRFADEIDELPDTLDDDVLWGHPWVLYNNGHGSGSARKQEWRDDRYETCWAAMHTEVENDATGTFVRPISLCDVTGPLQDLCTALRNAVASIENANCIASGDDCEVLGSFYTPAQWFTGNKAFARETVRDFYLYAGTGGGVCSGEASRTAQVEQENARLREHCPASYMEVVKDSLQFLRLIVRMLVAAAISALSIIIDCFMFILYLASGRDARPLFGDILSHIDNLTRLIGEAIKQLMNTLLYMLANVSDVGRQIVHVALFICKLVMLLKRFVLDMLLCTIFRGAIFIFFELMDVVVWTLNILKDAPIIGFLVSFINLEPWTEFKSIMEEFAATMECAVKVPWKSAAPFVGQVLSVVENVAGQVRTEAVSAFTGNLACEMPMDYSYATTTAHAFLASRCWANPSHGGLLAENNVLGCSAADTCKVDALGEELLACERCPAVDVNAFSRFGCDTFLKKCRCGVPLLSKTSCLSNAECADHVQCAIRATASATSHGVFDCLDSCISQPVCLVQDTATNGLPPAGECTCLLEPPVIPDCDTAGVLVNMAVQNDLCYFARDPSLAGTVAVFQSNVIQQSELTLVPCALLSRSRQHLSCQQVQYPQGTVRRHIVGSALVSLPEWGAFQRRLLWQNASAPVEDAWQPLADFFLRDTLAAWDDAPLCGELVRAGQQQGRELAVLDREELKKCVKWRAVMNTSLLIHNLTAVAADTALLTWAGLARMLADEAGRVLTTPQHSVLGLARAYAGCAYYVAAQLDGAQAAALLGRRLLIIVERLLSRLGGGGGARSTAAPNRTGNAQRAHGPWSEPLAVTSTWPNTSQITTAFTAASWQLTGQLPPPDAVRWLTAQSPRTAEQGGASARAAPPPPPPQGSRRHMPHARGLKSETELAGRWPVDWAAVDWGLRSADEEFTCELFDITKASFDAALQATKTYYEDGYRARDNVSRTIQGNLMHVVPGHTNESVSKAVADERRQRMQASQQGVPVDGFAHVAMDFGLSLISFVTDVRVDDVVAFFDPKMSLQEQIDADVLTLERLMADATQCDVDRMMLCSYKPRALLPAFVISSVAIWLLCQMLWMSSGLTVLIMLLLVPWVGMWYAYGYSPMCFPMIPTCFMHDLVQTVQETLPARVEWPALMIRQDVCSRDGVPYDPSQRGQLNCFKSCANDDFRFHSWEDPFAWLLCEIDRQACRRFGEWVFSLTSWGKSFRDATVFFDQVIALGSTHANDAYRMCALLTGYYIVPAAVFALWSFFMVSIITRAVVALAFKTLVFVFANVSSGYAPAVDA